MSKQNQTTSHPAYSSSRPPTQDEWCRQCDIEQAASNHHFRSRIKAGHGDAAIAIGTIVASARLTKLTTHPEKLAHARDMLCDIIQQIFNEGEPHA